MKFDYHVSNFQNEKNGICLILVDFLRYIRMLFLCAQDNYHNQFNTLVMDDSVSIFFDRK